MATKNATPRIRREASGYYAVKVDGKIRYHGSRASCSGFREAFGRGSIVKATIKDRIEILESRKSEMLYIVMDDTGIVFRTHGLGAAIDFQIRHHSPAAICHVLGGNGDALPKESPQRFAVIRGNEVVSGVEPMDVALTIASNAPEESVIAQVWTYKEFCRLHVAESPCGTAS